MGVAGVVHARAMDPAVLAGMARLTVASTDVGVHRHGPEVVVSVLWHNHDEPAPRILASRFAGPGTEAELRALADILDGVFAGVAR